MRSMGRGSVGVAMAFVVVCAHAAEARAGGDEAAAEALFLEAKKLAAQEKYGEACPKFAESNRLDRGAGTLIHLGDCYEKNKQTASAWATYKEAASAAQALGRKDWEKLASQRANALEAKLARLKINVDKANDTIAVSRDGTSISKASFGVPIPVDVGSHSVEATSAGHKPFKTSVTVSKDGESVEVSVPKLEAEAVAEPAPAPKPAAATPPPKPENDGSGQRTFGFIVGGVGVAGLAAGAITGLMAMSKSSDAKATCTNDGPCADRNAVDASESAKTLGLVSTIGFIAGGVALAAGAALVFTAPKEGGTGVKSASGSSRSRPVVRFAPSASPTGGGLTVLGVF